MAPSAHTNTNTNNNTNNNNNNNNLNNLKSESNSPSGLGLGPGVTPSDSPVQSSACSQSQSQSQSQPPLSLSIPSMTVSAPKCSQFQQSGIVSPTTYALTHKPIILDTPDNDMICRPVGTPLNNSNNNNNSNNSAGFDIDLGIQNMTILNPTASTADMVCKPVLNSNPTRFEGTCSLGRGSLVPVLLDTPDKDKICRPVASSTRRE